MSTEIGLIIDCLTAMSQLETFEEKHNYIKLIADQYSANQAQSHAIHVAYRIICNPILEETFCHYLKNGDNLDHIVCKLIDMLNRQEMTHFQHQFGHILDSTCIHHNKTNHRTFEQLLNDRTQDDQIIKNYQRLRQLVEVPTVPVDPRLDNPPLVFPVNPPDPFNPADPFNPINLEIQAIHMNPIISHPDVDQDNLRLNELIRQTTKLYQYPSQCSTPIISGESDAIVTQTTLENSMYSLDINSIHNIFTYIPQGHWPFIGAVSRTMKEIVNRLGQRSDLSLMFSRPSLIKYLKRDHYYDANGDIPIEVKDQVNNLFWNQCQPNQVNFYQHYLNPHCLSWCALFGNLTCFRYLYEHFPLIQNQMVLSKDQDYDPTKQTFNPLDPILLATYGGHVSILQYLNPPFDHSLVTLAIRHGHVSILKYLHERSPPYPLEVKDLRFAVSCLQDSCYQYLKTIIDESETNHLIYEVQLNSPSVLSLTHLPFVLTQTTPPLFPHMKIGWERYPLSLYLCYVSIIRGNLSVLKHLHYLGCPLDNTILAQSAIAVKRCDILQYLDMYGCPVHNNIDLIRSPDTDVDPTLTISAKFIGDLLHHAIFHDACQCLQYLLNHGRSFKENLYQQAIKARSQSCLRYLVEIYGGTTSITPEIYEDIIEMEDIDYLRIIINHIKLSEELYLIAIRRGLLDHVKLLHEHQCPWDTRIYLFKKYAENDDIRDEERGHRYLPEKNTLILFQNRLACIKYAYQNGCPYDETSLDVKTVIDIIKSLD